MSDDAEPHEDEETEMPQEEERSVTVRLAVIDTTMIRDFVTFASADEEGEAAKFPTARLMLARSYWEDIGSPDHVRVQASNDDD